VEQREPRDAAPGEWAFSLNARASRFHRWDLTERADNPRLIAMERAMFPADGRVASEEMVLGLAKSNLRGTATLRRSRDRFSIRVDSAGFKRRIAGLYRAFQPGVADGVSAEQYFTAERHWWLAAQVGAAAFSSTGGKITNPGLRQRRAWSGTRGMEKKRVCD